MGASAGKKALHRTLDSIVAGKTETTGEDLGLVFDEYVGKEKKGSTTPRVLNVQTMRYIFKDIIEYQRKTGLNVFNLTSKAFYASPQYKSMGFLERAGATAMITGVKATIVTIFDVAMSNYASDQKMNRMLRNFSSDGVVTREIFCEKAIGVIGTELVAANLIVSKDIAKGFERYNVSMN